MYNFGGVLGVDPRHVLAHKTWGFMSIGDQVVTPAPPGSGLRRPLFLNINLNVLHLRQIDHQAIVANRIARDVVPAALDRNQHGLITPEVDRSDHILRRMALGNQRLSILRPASRNTSVLLDCFRTTAGQLVGFDQESD